MNYQDQQRAKPRTYFTLPEDAPRKQEIGTATPDAPVTTTLNLLAEQLEEAHDGITSLEQRLQLVMSPPAAVDGSPQSVTAPPHSCELEGRLKICSERASDLGWRLNRLCSRIQL